MSSEFIKTEHETFRPVYEYPICLIYFLLPKNTASITVPHQGGRTSAHSPGNRTTELCQYHGPATEDMVRGDECS